MGPAQAGAGHHPAQEGSRPGAHRARLERPGSHRETAGQIRLWHVLPVSRLHRGARSRQRPLALARRAFRRAPHGRVLGDTVLDHYTAALGEIAHAGFFAYWSRGFRPYLRGAAEQFAPTHISLTERLLKRD